MPRAGAVIDGTAHAEGVWRRLGLATRSGLEVSVDGASWWWPQRLDGVQPGDEVLVYAELPATEAMKVRIGDGEVRDVALEPATPQLLARFFAQAQIASLLERERRSGEDVHAALVKLSTEHRVLSPYTALLVLETEADYRRFGLERRALAEILTVKEGRVAVRSRDALAAEEAQPPPRPAGSELSRGNDPLDARGNMWGDRIGDSFGQGGLGSTGIGEGGGGDATGIGSIGSAGPGPAEASPPPPAPGTGTGFGSGHGRLGRSHRARPPQVRMGATQVSGRLPPEIIQRIVRQRFGTLRACYEDGLRRNPRLQGRVSVRFVIEGDGAVEQAQATGEIEDAEVLRCIAAAFRQMTFPAPEGGIITVVYPVVFQPQDTSADPAPPAPQPVPAPPRAAPAPVQPPPNEEPTWEPVGGAAPLSGKYAAIAAAAERGDTGEALRLAQAWHAAEPGDLLAVVALGEALEHAGKPAWAARAYGSIVDLFPTRADLRRYAGARLERLADARALELAVDTYEKAQLDRPEDPTSHRLLAYALVKQGRHRAAFDAIATALERRFAARHDGAGAVLRGDLGLIGAAWIADAPDRLGEVMGKLAGLGVDLAERPSLRIVLSWETDANDVDLHVYDADGRHAFYGSPVLASGGQLHGDVTTGYGPELFEVVGPRSDGYSIGVHYYSRGAMGYGLGKVEIVEHDGRGGLRFEQRPFVVMNDRAWVELGTFGSFSAKRAGVRLGAR
jgi:tetratricopeptide (TPR) repeat protein